MILSHYIARGAIGLAAVTAIAASPLALARNDDNKNEDKHVKVAAATRVTTDIDASGHVWVRGAVVTGVSGDTVTATTEWNSAVVTWSIIAASSTEVIDKNGKGKNDSFSLADIKAGDTINFQGSMKPGATGLVVNARVIRDLSVMKPSLLKDIFQGRLESVASTTLPATIGLKVGSTLYTVDIPVGTPLLKSDFSATTLGSFHVGDTVRVFGSISAATSTLINALIVRDASI